VIFSGDRHIGAISKYDIKGLGPIFEITASAINKTRSEPEKDSTYIGNTVNKDNFGLALIDWKKKTLKVELRDINDEIGNSVEFKF
jgi:alkaline phosphatase D